MGDDESHFSQDEFELVQLFAAQASIALRNAEAHGAVMTQAEHDALTGLRNHGAFQREWRLLIAREQPFGLLMLDLDAFKAYNDWHGHPEGDALLARIATAMAGALRDGDRVYRYGGDEFAVLLPGISGGAVREVIERVRAAVVLLTQETGPTVTVSAGAALYPDDATEKDDLVAVADRALYLAKPADRLRLGMDDPTRDPYLAAIDQMTLRLLERLEPRQLLREIVDRAAGLVGVKSGFLYLLEDNDGGQELVCRVGVGLFDGLDGYRLPHGTGIGWTVVRSGRPMNVNDYGAYPNPARRAGRADVRRRVRGAADLRRRGAGHDRARVRRRARPFSDRELEALSRFAQLASIALDNARLFERAQTEGPQRAHAALHDMLTGLPNRTAPAEPDGRAPRRRPRRPTARPSGPRVALILLDLDRFKVVNESLGHAAGDLLLAEVARPARVDRSLDRRRRPPRQRRVRRAARSGAQRARGGAGGRPDHRRCRRAVRPRRPGGHRRRQPRARGRPAVDHVRRRPAQGGGDRAPPGEARPGPQVRHVRPRDARRDAGPGDARARPPARHRALRAARSTTSRWSTSTTGTVVGPRGAAPLAAPDPRPRARRCRSSRSPRRPA